MSEKPPADLGKDERFRFANKPELTLAFKGLEITVSEGFMTRTQAEAMLRSWDATPAPSDLHDQTEGGGDVAA